MSERMIKFRLQQEEILQRWDRKIEELKRILQTSSNFSPSSSSALLSVNFRSRTELLMEQDVLAEQIQEAPRKGLSLLKFSAAKGAGAAKVTGAAKATESAKVAATEAADASGFTEIAEAEKFTDRAEATIAEEVTEAAESAEVAVTSGFVENKAAADLAKDDETTEIAGVADSTKVLKPRRSLEPWKLRIALKQQSSRRLRLQNRRASRRPLMLPWSHKRLRGAGQWRLRLNLGK